MNQLKPIYNSVVSLWSPDFWLSGRMLDCVREVVGSRLGWVTTIAHSKIHIPTPFTSVFRWLLVAWPDQHKDTLHLVSRNIIDICTGAEGSCHCKSIVKSLLCVEVAIGFLYLLAFKLYKSLSGKTFLITFARLNHGLSDNTCHSKLWFSNKFFPIGTMLKMHA